MRFRWLVACVAGLLVLVCAPSFAATSTGTLTVSAARSATVDLTLRDVALDWSRLQVRGGGPTVAVYFESLDRPGRDSGGLISETLAYVSGPSMVLELAADDYGAADGGTGPRFASVRNLKRGRYRIHVVASGALTVSLPIGRGASYAVKATGRSSDVAQISRVAGTPTAVPGGAMARMALPATGPTATTVAAIVTGRTRAPSSTKTVVACRRVLPAQPNLPVCTESDRGDKGFGNSHSQYDVLVQPPVPVPVPMGSKSLFAAGQFYGSGAPKADLLINAATTDFHDGVYALVVAIALR